MQFDRALLNNFIFVHVMDIAAVIILLILWCVFDKAVKHVIRKTFSIAIDRLSCEDDREGGAVLQRLVTLRNLVTQLIRGIVAFIMIYCLLERVGVDVKPIIAGIGIAGLAISLAAQNVIRDFINGALILIEDQYNVGDWVEINTYSGTVERFTLRTTRLRDIKGGLVVLPNSQIQTVVNNTKNWSVALIKISVPYESDYKKAVSIMQELGDRMYGENDSSILERPLVQGITEFSANSLDLRALIKTVPGQQWKVEREYRTRIKDLFDSESITFAYPQMVVHNTPSEI